MWSSETFSWSNTPNIARRYQSKTHLLLFYVCVRVCFVVLLWEGNRFFFCRVFFSFFCFLVKIFAYFSVLLCRSSLFSNRRLLYHHRKRKDTSAPREREIYKERFEREFFYSRGETQLLNTRTKRLKDTKDFIASLEKFSASTRAERRRRLSSSSSSSPDFDDDSLWMLLCW